MWLAVLFCAVFMLLIAAAVHSAMLPVDTPRARANRMLLRAPILPIDQAEPVYVEALALAQESGDGLLCSEACYGLGDICMRRRQFDKAEAHFSRALSYMDRWYEHKPNYERLLQSRLEEARNQAHAAW